MIESEAIDQLTRTSQLEGIEEAVGFSDIHVGGGIPIGAAYISKKILYPYLLGNDVGCGFGLFMTNQKTKKIKLDRLIKKLDTIKAKYSKVGSKLVTIGGGNHFAEFQVVEKIFKKDTFQKLGLNKNFLLILVHTGSRNLGQKLFNQYYEKHGIKRLEVNSDFATEYINEHDKLIDWATENRYVVAQKLSDKINKTCEPILDSSHNSIIKVDFKEETFWLHRKGCSPSNTGPIIIPGSRGTLSYLVEPKNGSFDTAWSLPHGAGRKWVRSSCKGKLSSKYPVKALKITSIGNYVLYDDKNSLYEEHPKAYKNVEVIIDFLVEKKLIDVVATFKPIITYKKKEV